jgi:DNA processing protein
VNWAHFELASEKAELSAICSLPGITFKQARDLLVLFGSARGAWDAVSRGYDAGPPDSKLEIWRSWAEGVEPASRMAAIERDGTRLLAIGEPRYPPPLAEIAEPPITLYLRGSLPAAEAPCLAVVGSRKATPYGLEAARYIAGGLSRAGAVVASGAAYGVDSAAHRGALEQGGFTIAVLGCGPDIAYPRSHAGLLREIEENGCVLSEYPPGTPPLKRNFPARNRIIAGLSRGVVVIEAAEGSGALLTAEVALSAGREIFAVPGGVFSRNSAGTNALIRNGAALARSPEDVLEELGLAESSARGARGRPGPRQEELPLESSVERLLLEALANGLTDPHDIADRMGLSTIKAIAGLSRLEVSGLVRRGPGGVYQGVAPRSGKVNPGTRDGAAPQSRSMRK